MSKKTTILQLDEYCLFEIFKQIKYNCDKKKIYADLINFSMACPMLRYMFWTWNRELFMKFGVNKDKHQIIDFEALYNELKHFPMKDKEMWWKYFSSHIKENKTLTTLRLVYYPKAYRFEHGERFKQILCALENSNIEDLHIAVRRGYSIDTLPKLPYLKALHLDVKINANDLVKICKMTPLLEEITFLSTEIYGNLADITPHCQKLKKLIFKMKPDIHASEYSTFGDLPALESLTIKGHHQVGTLAKLFKLLAIKEPKTIQEIFIENAPLNYEEAKEFAKLMLMKSSFQFSDIQSIEHLQFFRIINIHRYLHEVWNDLWLILKKTNKSFYLCLIDWHFIYNNEPNELLLKRPNGKFSDDMIKPYKNTLKTLTLQVRSNVNASIYVPSAALENLHSLHIIGSYQYGTLNYLFKTFAQQGRPTLKEIHMKLWPPLSLDEIIQITQIKSLQKLSCQFVEENVYIEKFYYSFGSNTNGFLSDGKYFSYGIEMSLENGQLTMKCEHDIDPNEHLRKVENLQSLIIVLKNNYQNGLLGKIFAHLKQLPFDMFQELIIRSESLTEVPTLSAIEVAQIAQIKSLRNLECGFENSTNLKLLAQLSELNELIITKHKKGSLTDLFKEIVSNGDASKLRTLIIKHEELTTDEIAQVKLIKSLENVDLKYSSTASYFKMIKS